MKQTALSKEHAILSVSLDSLPKHHHQCVLSKTRACLVYTCQPPAPADLHCLQSGYLSSARPGSLTNPISYSGQLSNNSPQSQSQLIELQMIQCTLVEINALDRSISQCLPRAIS
ncbi:Vacuolar fusion protein MON1 [Fusarium oxysporum f. sp. albedinis]|nr:Vacuolar fusion protein MON1 [Fusarium oxysporum f. sp. albedinis]